jgi:hypothetical protein
MKVSGFEQLTRGWRKTLPAPRTADHRMRRRKSVSEQLMRVWRKKLLAPEQLTRG